MSAIRKAVTSIVQMRADGAAAPSESVVTKEQAPHKQEVFLPEDLDSPKAIARCLHLIQRNTDDATRSARSLPVLGGTYWPGVALAANTPKTILHGVQGAPVSMMHSAPSAAARIWVVSQDAAHGRIVVEADAACSADLWFFPTPSASRT